MARGVQGTVTASASSVESGGKVHITITTKPGFRVSSVTINGEEKIADVNANAVDGVYTITNVTSHQEIRVGYEKVDGVQFAGVVTDGTNPITADAKLISTTDKSLCYTFIANGAKGFDVKVPTGNYKLIITALGYKALVKDVTVSADVSETYALEESEFLSTVKVGNSVLASGLDKWDLTYVADGKVSVSYSNGGKDKPLYFKETAADFAIEISAKYTTKFILGGDYQRNLMAGFRFHDGRNTTMLCAVDRGIVYSNTNGAWTYKQDLLPDTERVLYYYPAWGYSEANPVTFGIAKIGNDVNIYINGKLAMTTTWSTVAAGLDPNKEVAIGMMMVADKEADLEISNYKLMTGTTAAQDYINAHK
jgi:hypothetical protein